MMKHSMPVCLQARSLLAQALSPEKEQIDIDGALTTIKGSAEHTGGRFSFVEEIGHSRLQALVFAVRHGIVEIR